jgi:hypothetical protein
VAAASALIATRSLSRRDKLCVKISLAAGGIFRMVIEHFERTSYFLLLRLISRPILHLFGRYSLNRLLANWCEMRKSAAGARKRWEEFDGI